MSSTTADSGSKNNRLNAHTIQVREAREEGALLLQILK